MKKTTKLMLYSTQLKLKLELSLAIIENVMDPVGSIDGPRLGLNPIRVSSCAPRVPWYVFIAQNAKIQPIQQIFSYKP